MTSANVLDKQTTTTMSQVLTTNNDESAGDKRKRDDAAADDDGDDIVQMLKKPAPPTQLAEKAVRKSKPKKPDVYKGKSGDLKISACGADGGELFTFYIDPEWPEIELTTSTHGGVKFHYKQSGRITPLLFLRTVEVRQIAYLSPNCEPTTILTPKGAILDDEPSLIRMRIDGGKYWNSLPSIMQFIGDGKSLPRKPKSSSSSSSVVPKFPLLPAAAAAASLSTTATSDDDDDDDGDGHHRPMSKADIRMAQKQQAPPAWGPTAAAAADAVAPATEKPTPSLSPEKSTSAAGLAPLPPPPADWEMKCDAFKTCLGEAKFIQKALDSAQTKIELAGSIFWFAKNFQQLQTIFTSFTADMHSLKQTHKFARKKEEELNDDWNAKMRAASAAAAATSSTTTSPPRTT